MFSGGRFIYEYLIFFNTEWTEIYTLLFNIEQTKNYILLVILYTEKTMIV